MLLFSNWPQFALKIKIGTFYSYILSTDGTFNSRYVYAIQNIQLKRNIHEESDLNIFLRIFGYLKTLKHNQINTIVLIC